MPITRNPCWCATPQILVNTSPQNSPPRRGDITPIACLCDIVDWSDDMVERFYIDSSIEDELGRYRAEQIGRTCDHLIRTYGKASSVQIHWMITRQVIPEAG